MMIVVVVAVTAVLPVANANVMPPLLAMMMVVMVTA
jgi:hypothetical protein